MNSAGILANPDFREPSGAVISSDGRYRYWLHRRWLHGSGWAVFIMLNPSTADATIDDPTIRRCRGFAGRLGHSGLIVVNLFALRATDPRELARANDPEGPENHAHVLKACELAAQAGDDDGRPEGTVICAWGAHKLAAGQSDQVLGWIHAAGATAHCFGRTGDGHPRHPLYLRSDAPLQVYLS